MKEEEENVFFLFYFKYGYKETEDTLSVLCLVFLCSVIIFQVYNISLDNNSRYIIEHQ